MVTELVAPRYLHHWCTVLWCTCTRRGEPRIENRVFGFSSRSLPKMADEPLVRLLLDMNGTRPLSGKAQRLLRVHSRCWYPGISPKEKSISRLHCWMKRRARCFYRPQRRRHRCADEASDKGSDNNAWLKAYPSAKRRLVKEAVAIAANGSANGPQAGDEKPM